MKNRNIPFGYCYESGCIVLATPDSAVVKGICEDYIGGSSMLEIAMGLNERKVEYLPGVAVIATSSGEKGAGAAVGSVAGSVVVSRVVAAVVGAVVGAVAGCGCVSCAAVCAAPQPAKQRHSKSAGRRRRACFRTCFTSAPPYAFACRSFSAASTRFSVVKNRCVATIGPNSSMPRVFQRTMWRQEV